MQRPLRVYTHSYIHVTVAFMQYVRVLSMRIQTAVFSNNDNSFDFIFVKRKGFIKMSKQGIVNTFITLRILQYEMATINFQGLHTFAV